MPQESTVVVFCAADGAAGPVAQPARATTVTADTVAALMRTVIMRLDTSG
jgi:hypothetical protein